MGGGFGSAEDVNEEAGSGDEQGHEEDVDPLDEVFLAADFFFGFFLFFVDAFADVALFGFHGFEAGEEGVVALFGGLLGGDVGVEGFDLFVHDFDVPFDAFVSGGADVIEGIKWAAG